MLWTLIGISTGADPTYEEVAAPNLLYMTAAKEPSRLNPGLQILGSLSPVSKPPP